MRDINDVYQEFIYKRTYSRYLDKEQRRETWEETVDRYFEFFKIRVPEKLLPAYEKAKGFILEKKIMPSMRCLWAAGKALERENLAAYNCSATIINRTDVFGELLYLLMCGAGVGISVERQYVNELPNVPEVLVPDHKTIVVGDSKMGWAKAYNELIQMLYKGKIPLWDVSKIRPEGALLKTFGGRASGPKPLVQLFEFTIRKFQSALGRKFNSLEAHDICCMISSIVQVGGTRRAALISLSNLSDTRMKKAKEGQFWNTHSYRTLANNSVAYTEKPEMKIFMEEWLSLAYSGTGERGIFNRESANKIIARNGRRQPIEDAICNPCSEIILRPDGLCNLTEVIVRPKDTLNDLTEKVKFATILGILQSTLTDFSFVNENWKKNAEEERLLGVSLTGIMDHPILSNEKKADRLEDWLTAMRDTAIKVAKKWSKAMEINMPAAITCVKPSGTVSQLVDSASGIHPRYAPHYIRRVRVAKTDPISQFLIDKGVAFNPDSGTLETCTMYVFDFPIKAPKKAVYRNDKSAIEQLMHWKMMQEFWCEHKPSMTCYVREHEWLRVGAWVYDHFDIVSGISFLPFDNSIYQLAPYEEITEEKWKELVKAFPKNIDFEELKDYEKEDNTEGAIALACTGDACEIV